MTNRKHVWFGLFVALALILGLVSSGANAQSNSDAVVTLTTDQAQFTAAQDIIIHVTISNPTNHTIRVLKWYTPVDGVEGPLFAVARDGAAVPYIGAIYKRPKPDQMDYINLKAGESITNDVSLAMYYDLSVTGSYQVAYDVASLELSSPKGGKSGKVETLTSDPIGFQAEGRQSGDPALALMAPEAVAGSTSFNKCTTTQQSTLVSARNEAYNYTVNANAYLQAGTRGLRYTTWFGVFDQSRYNKVGSNFTSIGSAMNTAPVTFDCGCKKKYYAYVYPTQPYKIYVCSIFWQAPLTGTDSKAGTIIHEMSHFNVVAGTDDYVYGQTNAKNLAISNPSNAIDNADNHEYFAENTPALP